MTKSDAISFLQSALDASRDSRTGRLEWSARDRQAVEILIERVEKLETVLQGVREVLGKSKDGTIFNEVEYTQCATWYYTQLRLWKELSEVFPVDPELLTLAEKYTRKQNEENKETQE